LENQNEKGKLTMKKFMMGAIVAMLFSMLTGYGAWAADATLAVDANSAYVWRGITFNDGFVIQPSLDVSHEGFGINVWGNIDIDDYDNTLKSGEMSEVDLTLSYGFNIKDVGISFGYIDYLFPNGGESTQEFYGSLEYNIYKGLTAGLGVYYDFDEINDVYANVSLGYNLEFNDKFSMDFGASLGYMGKDYAIAYGGTDSGLHEYTLSVGANYAITKAWGVAASVTYVDSADTDVMPDQDTEWWGGVNLSYSF